MPEPRDTDTPGAPAKLATIRRRAKQHEDELESLRWWKPKQLAERWGVSVTTVYAIAREDLPYKEFGKARRRRYHPDDVAAFEASGRMLKRGVA